MRELEHETSVLWLLVEPNCGIKALLMVRPGGLSCFQASAVVNTQRRQHNNLIPSMCIYKGNSIVV